MITSACRAHCCLLTLRMRVMNFTLRARCTAQVMPLRPFKL